MQLLARRTFKNSPYYEEVEINSGVETYYMSYVDKFGIEHTGEKFYRIENDFIIPGGTIHIPESSFNKPLFNLDHNDDNDQYTQLMFYTNQFKEMPMYNCLLIPDSIHMISLNKKDLKKYWDDYYADIHFTLAKYIDIIKDKCQVKKNEE